MRKINKNINEIVFKKKNQISFTIMIISVIWSFYCERWLLDIPSVFSGSIVKLALYIISKMVMAGGVLYLSASFINLWSDLVNGIVRIRIQLAFFSVFW